MKKRFDEERLGDMNIFRQFSSFLVLGVYFGFVWPVPAASQLIPDDRDRQVLEVVLLRVLTDPDCDMTRISANGTTIVLNLRTPEKTGMIRREQMENDVGKGHPVPNGVQNDLLRRNEKPGTYDSQLASFAGLNFDQRVVITNVTAIVAGDRFGRAFTQAQPKARAWVEAWLPGYSKDGAHAIVRAWIGPSDHGAVITAFLEKKGDKWVIKWFQLTHFV